jgi:hypothetical protein
MDAIVTPDKELQPGNKLMPTHVQAIERTQTPTRMIKPEEYLAKLCDEADKECEHNVQGRAALWLRNYYFWLGGVHNAYGWALNGAWRPQTNLKGLFTANMLAEKFNTLMSVVTRSNPKYKLTPTPGGQEQEIKHGGAIVAQRISDHDMAEKFQQTARLREWFCRLMYGNSFRYGSFDKDAGHKTQVPTMGQTQVDVPGMGLCPKCGMTAPANGEQSCPECGQPSEYFEGESFTDETQEGYEDSMSGDTRWWVVSPWEIGLPPNARLSQDNGELQWDYIVWCQRVRKKRIAQAYEIGTNIEDVKEIPFMLRAQERMERKGGGDPRDHNSQFCTFRRYWFRPYMYYDWKITQDVTLADGTQVPRGTKMIEACPHGIYVARVGETILDVQPACIDDHWSQAHYYFNPQSPWGKGIDDAAELQRVINALYQIAVEHARRDSVGITTFNQNAGLTVESFKGGNVVPMDVPLDNPRGVLGQAALLQGTPMDNSVGGVIEMARNDQTAVTGASSVLSGTNETLPSTATATQLLVQRATSILTPMFLVDVEQGKRTVTQNLKLRQKYQSMETFVPFTDENEHEQGRFFSASDIPKDFVVSVVDGSWMPSDLLDARAELENALALGNVPLGIFNPDMPPHVQQAALNIFTSLPPSLNTRQADESVAHSRLQAIKEGVEHVKQMNISEEQWPTALEALLNMPSVVVRPDVDNIGVQIEVAQTYAKGVLNDPQGDFDLLLIQAVEGFIQKLKEATVAQGQEQSAMSLLTQQPDAQAQIAMQGLQGQQDAGGQQEPPPPDPNAIQAQMHEGQLHDADAMESEKGRQHEIATKKMDAAEADKQRKHDLAIAGMQAKAAKAKK